MADSERNASFPYRSILVFDPRGDSLLVERIAGWASKYRLSREREAVSVFVTRLAG